METVYDKIANEFSKTRHTSWPPVTAFLDKQQTGASCLDIGTCKLKFTGLDQSYNLASICASVSFAISIAVFHHLMNDHSRISACSEMIRILKSGGSGLISLWSVENQKSKKFTAGVNTVPFNKYLRYYNIYDIQMINSLLSSLNNDTFTVNRIFNDTGNWYIEIKKI